MCSVTLFKQANGYRVFMNRDESFDREEETPPQLLNSEHGIICPIDPLSGGTWIAHNKAGYWGCILNGYAEAEGTSSNAIKSRGLILPELLTQQNPLAAAIKYNASPYASFSLLIGSTKEHILFSWDGKRFNEREFHAAKNDMFFFTSSSWNQPEVIDTRIAVFQKWTESPTYTDKAIPTLHYNEKPASESAIMMRRSYSRTTSITSIDVTTEACSMAHHRIG